MSLMSRIRGALSALSGRNPTGEVPDWPQHFMHWAFSLPEAHLTHVEAFYKVPIVSAAVEKLAEDQASIPRKVYRGRGTARVEIERIGKPVELGGNLADLLYRANRLSVGSVLINEAAISLALTGNAYWHMQTGSPERPPAPNNQPVELWNLPGYLVRPQPAEKRTIELYDYDRSGTGNWQSVKAENIVHFRRASAKDEPIGKSPLDAVQDTYMAQYLAGKWLREFFQKGGVIAGLWSIDDKSGRNYSEAELNAMSERLRRLTMKPDGTADRWKAIVIQGVQFVAQGMKLSEMQLQQQNDQMEKQVARAVGVPPLMLGIKAGEGDLSTSASTEAMNYWLGKQASVARLIDDTLNERLAPLFGSDVYVQADWSQVPAVAAMMLEQAKVQKELAGGRAIITPNEAREHPSIGLEPHADGDELNAPPPASPFGAPPGAGVADDKDAEDEKPKRQDRNTRLSATGDEREELRKKHADAVERFRRDFERLVMSRLSEQRGEVRAKVRAQVEDRLARRARLQTLDPRDLIGEPDDADLERAQRLIERLLRERGIDAVKDLEKALGVALEVAVEMNNTRAAEFVRKMVERAISIPDATTRKALRESLAEGVAANEDMRALVERVDAVFDAREGQALAIVRTEAGGAFNFASVEAYQQSGVVDHHEWLTSRSGLGGRHSENPDGRYTGLDGQVRALGEPFDVGGVAMLYPGDPGAPADETVNCVCTTAPIVNADRLAQRRLAVALKHARSHANGNGKSDASRLRDWFAGVGR